MSTEIVSREASAGWGSSNAPVVIPPSEVGVISAVAREEAEIKSAIVLARQFPRNEAASHVKLMKSCQRPGFAETARYVFPRGGQNVEGPSIDMAREAARVWGNIRYGLRVVSSDEDMAHIKGYALDLENNNYVECEDRFALLVQRKNKVTKQTEWIKPDERDRRELINRRGAILIRNAILQLLPPDLIDDATEQVKDTIRRAAGGEIKQSREQAVKRLVMAFDQLAVTPAMLEARLGHPLDAITPEELADLRGIYKSMVDGNSKRSDYFETAPAAPSGPTLDEKVAAMLEADAGAKPLPRRTRRTNPAPEPEPEPIEGEIVGQEEAQEAPIPYGGAFVPVYDGWPEATRDLYDEARADLVEAGRDPLDAHADAYRKAVGL